MKNTQIRWAAVQPLTGGMYLGTQNATGTPAQFILSYEGLNAIKKNRAGEEIAAVNEALLQRYLEKTQRYGKLLQFRWPWNERR